MSLAFHEIAERYHQILNPFTFDKLMLLGEACRLQSGMTQLDLCCGKGEMLCQWALKYGISGVGVDISTVFTPAAQARAAELGLSDRLTFIQADAATYKADQQFDVVSCIGATWIGNGLVGTIKLMQAALKPGGLLLVGEPYWTEEPPEAAYEAIGVGKDDYTTLVGTLDRMESAGCELVEMVLSNPDSWDRYEAPQWLAVSDYAREHPGDPQAAEVRAWKRKDQRAYLQYGRRYFNWGVFALRVES